MTVLTSAAVRFLEGVEADDVDPIAWKQIDKDARSYCRKTGLVARRDGTWRLTDEGRNALADIRPSPSQET